MRALTPFLVSAWLGAAVFFAAVVAPGAFAVLPGHELAGGLVVRVLPPLFLTGLVIGLVAAILNVSRQRWSGIIIALSCAIAQFVIAPVIDRLRAGISGPVDALPSSDPRQADFAMLHGASVLALVAAMIGALVIVLASWRSYGQHSR